MDNIVNKSPEIHSTMNKNDIKGKQGLSQKKPKRNMFSNFLNIKNNNNENKSLNANSKENLLLENNLKSDKHINNKEEPITKRTIYSERLHLCESKKINSNEIKKRNQDYLKLQHIEINNESDEIEEKDMIEKIYNDKNSNNLIDKIFYDQSKFDEINKKNDYKQSLNNLKQFRNDFSTNKINLKNLETQHNQFIRKNILEQTKENNDEFTKTKEVDSGRQHLLSKKNSQKLNQNNYEFKKEGEDDEIVNNNLIEKCFETKNKLKKIKTLVLTRGKTDKFISEDYSDPDINNNNIYANTNVNTQIKLKIPFTHTNNIDSSYSNHKSLSKDSQISNGNLETDNQYFTLYEDLENNSIINKKSKALFINKNFRNLIPLKNICDSMSELEEEKEIIEHNLGFMNENSSFRVYWSLLIIILIFDSVTLGIFRYTYYPNDFHGFFFYLDIVIDFFFLMDLILHFFIPYYEGEKLHLNIKLIAINYLQGWFLLDLLSSLPVNLLLLIKDRSKANILSIINYSENSLNANDNFSNQIPYSESYININLYTNISLNMISNQQSSLKILRYLRVLKLIKLFSHGKNTHLFSEILFNKKYKLTGYFKLCVIFVILTHISTCLWISFGGDDFNNLNSWIHYLYNFWNLKNFDIYIASLYFNLLTIYTVGYGDIVAKNNSERIYSIFLLTIGNLLFSFGISYLSFLFASRNELKNKYKDKKKILENLRKKHYIPLNLYRQIKLSIKELYTKVHVEKFIILDNLPLSLKREMVLSMNQQRISNFNFFKFSEKEFLIEVLPLLKNHSLNKNDILIPFGSIIEEIYLINNGILSICLDNLFNNIQVSQLKKNFHFGDILIHLNEKSPYILKCYSNTCEYMLLSKSDYYKIGVIYYKEIMKILEFSCEFLESIEKIKMVIVALFDEGKKGYEIKQVIKKIDAYLLNTNFNEYYYYNRQAFTVEDFFLYNDIEEIIKFSQTEMTEIDFLMIFYNEYNTNFYREKKSNTNKIHTGKNDNSIKNTSLIPYSNTITNNDKNLSENNGNDMININSKTEIKHINPVLKNHSLFNRLIPSWVMQKQSIKNTNISRNNLVNSNSNFSKISFFKERLKTMGNNSKSLFSDKVNLVFDKKAFEPNEAANSSIKEENSIKNENDGEVEEKPEKIDDHEQEINLNEKIKMMFGNKVFDAMKKLKDPKGNFDDLSLKHSSSEEKESPRIRENITKEKKGSMIGGEILNGKKSLVEKKTIVEVEKKEEEKEEKKGVSIFKNFLKLNKTKNDVQTNDAQKEIQEKKANSEKNDNNKRSDNVNNTTKRKSFGMLENFVNFMKKNVSEKIKIIEKKNAEEDTSTNKANTFGNRFMSIIRKQKLQKILDKDSLGPKKYDFNSFMKNINLSKSPYMKNDSEKTNLVLLSDPETNINSVKEKPKLPNIFNLKNLISVKAKKNSSVESEVLVSNNLNKDKIEENLKIQNPNENKKNIVNKKLNFTKIVKTDKNENVFHTLIRNKKSNKKYKFSSSELKIDYEYSYEIIKGNTFIDNKNKNNLNEKNNIYIIKKKTSDNQVEVNQKRHLITQSTVKSFDKKYYEKKAKFKNEYFNLENEKHFSGKRMIAKSTMNLKKIEISDQNILNESIEDIIKKNIPEKVMDLMNVSLEKDKQSFKKKLENKNQFKFLFGNFEKKYNIINQNFINIINNSDITQNNNLNSSNHINLCNSNGNFREKHSSENMSNSNIKFTCDDKKFLNNIQNREIRSSNQVINRNNFIHLKNNLHDKEIISDINTSYNKPSKVKKKKLYDIKKMNFNKQKAKYNESENNESNKNNKSDKSFISGQISLNERINKIFNLITEENLKSNNLSQNKIKVDE